MQLMCKFRLVGKEWGLVWVSSKWFQIKKWVKKKHTNSCSTAISL